MSLLEHVKKFVSEEELHDYNKLFPILNEMIKEEWRRFPENSYYSVSNWNHVLGSGEMPVKYDRDGYPTVVLCGNGKKSTHRICDMVASAFRDNPHKILCPPKHVPVEQWRIGLDVDE
jgi:hypothetical protein